MTDEIQTVMSVCRCDSSRLAMGTAGANHANRTGVFASVALAGSEGGVNVMVWFPTKLVRTFRRCVAYA
jgi:hypothetical protein